MTRRVELFERLPEIYKIKDEEQVPKDQLKNYLSLIEDAFSAVDENIESFYDDLFIETCDDWLIPYIADLVGTSHLSGDPWTLRADVADTIALRRRKGTLGAIERLTFDLTGWAVHCAELRENMAWNMHLNHQRPDNGDIPPYATSGAGIRRVIRGGTATIRDPAMLSLLNTPSDPFAHLADIRPPAQCARYNLPNLAIYLWRLEPYWIPVSQPFIPEDQPDPVPSPLLLDQAPYVFRSEVHPLGEPVVLFNVRKPFDETTGLTGLDKTPGPIPAARLCSRSAAGNWEEYVAIDYYDTQEVPGPDPLDTNNRCLQFHMPKDVFGPVPLEKWSFRGANLCDWGSSLIPPLQEYEIAIDPVIGRFIIGVPDETSRNALVKDLLLTYTYGAAGPVGAHPVSRPALPEKDWDKPTKTFIPVNYTDGSDLQTALNLPAGTVYPVIIEIKDSRTYRLDPSALNLMKLDGSLAIRAADHQRPVILLQQPLGFGVDNPPERVTVRLEGLYITRDPEVSPEPASLINSAMVDLLEIVGCTLDPKGYWRRDHKNRTDIRVSLELPNPAGFEQIPAIRICRSITGPLLMDTAYLLECEDSVIDAGGGVGHPAPGYALSGIGPAGSWGPDTVAEGVTFFGRTRVDRISGSGCIWVHSLEVNDNQAGCIRFSYFSGTSDRLPQNYGCVKGTACQLVFSSEAFGSPGYARIAQRSDFRIRERGPGDDTMGTFGFQLEAHKWRNIMIRYREFMPAGVRPLVIPVT